MQDASSGFAPVNGLNLYYEIHGEGQPLIMLHGGVSASEAFGQNLTELAKTRKVIALHLFRMATLSTIFKPTICRLMGFLPAHDTAAPGGLSIAAQKLKENIPPIVNV